MSKSLKKQIGCLLIPLAVGGLSALFTQNSMDTFQMLNKPPLSPPGWLFPVVWTILFLLMGRASYLVLTSQASKKSIQKAFTFYGLQLFFNFFWSIFFFCCSCYLFAFFWLILLEILILITTIQFYRISPTAGILMIPYLLWVAFAGYLNFFLYLLN